MEINVRTLGAAPTERAVEFADAVFGAPYNEALIHQVVVAYMAAGRAGTKAQKNRSDVRGGGKKPWKQKGSGRARAGTSRGPLWRGGGVTFAARPRSYEQKVNRKMYRGAMRSILSELLRSSRLTVVDSFPIEAPRTRDAVAMLGDRLQARCVLVADQVSPALFLATRNLHQVVTTDVEALDPVTLVGAEHVLVTAAAARIIEGRLA